MDTVTMMPTGPPSPIFPQIGAQLVVWIEPTSNQIALLRNISARHGSALLRAVNQYLLKRRCLLDLIQAPPGSEASGEVRTALRGATASHHAAVAATVAVSTEALTVLNESQRRRIAAFSPQPIADDEVRGITRRTALRLTRLEDSTPITGQHPLEALNDLATPLETLITALDFGPRIGEPLRAIILDNIRFWAVHPSLHPAGILGPAEVARLICGLVGLSTPAQPPLGWCLSLARAFDSPVLPAPAPDDRLKLATAGLLLLTHPFLHPSCGFRDLGRPVWDPNETTSGFG